jgi:hypothetical protein
MFCPYCGEPTEDTAETCGRPSCAALLDPAPPLEQTDAAEADAIDTEVAEATSTTAAGPADGSRPTASVAVAEAVAHRAALWSAWDTAQRSMGEARAQVKTVGGQGDSEQLAPLAASPDPFVEMQALVDAIDAEAAHVAEFERQIEGHQAMIDAIYRRERAMKIAAGIAIAVAVALVIALIVALV